MRFSKAPLIATLMAVALSLLVILPALAENSIKTDGQLLKGEAAGDRVAVGVFSDTLDAQYDWQAFTTGGGALTYDRDAQTLTGQADQLAATFQAGVTAYLLDNIGTGNNAHPADPRNTFFDGTLYVSNDSGAYNTVLIQCAEAVVGGDGCV